MFLMMSEVLHLAKVARGFPGSDFACDLLADPFLDVLQEGLSPDLIMAVKESL